MELPRFLGFLRSRRFLALSETSKANHAVPPLRDVRIKVSVHVSDDTLLEYQHDLRTNSPFFIINLTLNPSISDISAVQQYFVVNGLCDEFMMELDYDSSITAAATNSAGKEVLLVEYAENACNEKIAREIKIAEKLLHTDEAEFFSCVSQKVERLLDQTIDSESITAGDIPLFEKSSQVYLEWFSLIEPCIRDFVGKAGIDVKQFAFDNPFEFLDLEKLRTLGSLCGGIYEETSAWSRYPIQTRKYHVGSVRICPSVKISEERIKNCLAHCAASFFVTVAKSPIGRKFEDSSSELQEKFIHRAKYYFAIVESISREEKFAVARQAREHAKLLVEELGSEAERLKLAMQHDFNFLAIYCDTLKNHIRREIETSLWHRLKDLYGCKDVDISSSVRFANGDFLSNGKIVASKCPELLTLRVSDIVMEYFNSHPWLSRLNIKDPNIKLLTTYENDGNGKSPHSVCEFVLIRDYLDNKLIPGNSELVIDIDKIELEFDQKDEVITLQQV